VPYERVHYDCPRAWCSKDALSYGADLRQRVAELRLDQRPPGPETAVFGG
jgi:hypothetical protein